MYMNLIFVNYVKVRNINLIISSLYHIKNRVGKLLVTICLITAMFKNIQVILNILGLGSNKQAKVRKGGIRRTGGIAGWRWRNKRQEIRGWIMGDSDPAQIRRKITLHFFQKYSNLIVKRTKKRDDWGVKRRNVVKRKRVTRGRRGGTRANKDVKDLCRWFRFAQLAKGKKFRP